MQYIQYSLGTRNFERKKQRTKEIPYTLPALPCALPRDRLLLLDPQDAATGGGQQVIQASGLQPPGHC